jgi:hypothetical protein
MIQIETRDGPVHVPLARIVSITHAGTSSQWHGTRAIVKVDGERWPIESTEDAQTIASRCDAALRGER